MKKYILVILFWISALILLLSLCGCESKCEVKKDIDQLTSERSSIQNEIYSLENRKNQLHSDISALELKNKEAHIIASGKTPKYILKLHLKQSHFSLSITKHIKDAMNAIDFEIPVDKEYYESVSVGSQIVDKFRSGSMILYGSFGNWDMTVESKEIR
jgi:outer membrane murein-binding lipoprotein Lpp